MIKVLHVVGKMGMAGLETMIMNYYRNIDRSQVQFCFIPLTGEIGFYDDEINSLGGEILYPPSAFNWKKPVEFRKWFEETIKNGNYSILHSHNGGAASIVLPIAKKYGLNTILHSHNTGVRKESIIKQIARKTVLVANYHYVDLFFACSDDAGKYMFGNRSFTIINNAIDIEHFKYDQQIRKDIRNQIDFSDNQFVVGTVGRLTLQKNPYFIIDIIEALSKNYSNFRFLWVGDGELRNDIEQELHVRGLDTIVALPGAFPNVNDYYQAMDLFVLPSKFEGLGIVAIEAQASGLKTICSTNVPQIAAASEDCSFLSTDSVDAWVRSIEKVMMNHRERKDNSNSIREAGFDITIEANNLLDKYKSILNDK